MPFRQALIVATALTALAAPGTASALTGPQLSASLSREARALGPSASVHVKDLDSGQIIYSLRPDARLIPASNE